MPRTKRSYRLNPRFALDNNDANVVFLISSRIFPGGRFTYALGIPAKPAEWDKKNGRFRTGKTFPNGERRNKVLKSVSDKAYEITERGDGVSISKELLRSELDILLGRTSIVKSNQKDFFDFYESELDINRKQWKKGSLKALRTTFNLLKEFENETNYNIVFSTLSLDFHARFTSWLNQKNYSRNYVGKAIRNVRTILSMAEDLNYPVNPDFHKKSFKVYREESDQVYLSRDELDLLRDYKPNDPTHERCKDVLLFLCGTALRISDAQRINESHIYETYINVRAIKGSNAVTIPLDNEVKSILKKYNNSLPSISSAYFNREIKKVCRAAGIRKKETFSITRGGLRVDSVHEKWEMVSSHTGRRTLSTNLYLEGVPIQKIMMYTGHKTEAAFRRYIKADQLTIVRELTRNNA